MENCQVLTQKQHKNMFKKVPNWLLGVTVHRKDNKDLKRTILAIQENANGVSVWDVVYIDPVAKTGGICSLNHLRKWSGRTLSEVNPLNI